MLGLLLLRLLRDEGLPVMLIDLAPAVIETRYLTPIRADVVFEPFVLDILAPLLATECVGTWQAGTEEWGTVFRLTTPSTSFDFVFWAEEARFSFFVGTHEERWTSP